MQVNKGLRFPRSGYARRLGVMQEELRQWQNIYERRAQLTDSPVLEARLREHAAVCDEIWHTLSEANRTLWFWR